MTAHPPAPSFAMDTLFQVNMPVRDMERAVAFYRDTLRVPFYARRGNLAFFGVSGIRLMLEVIEESGGRYDHPGSILYLTVPDVADAHGDLVARGVAFVSGPELVRKDSTRELWMAFFEDGEGNTHAITSERAVSVPGSM